MKGKRLSYLLAFALISIGLCSCGAKSSGGDNENGNGSESEIDIAEVTQAPEEDQTIYGLIPGAQYHAFVDGMGYEVTLYKDGSTRSRTGGDGSWHIESIHDEPFISVSREYNDIPVFIDQNQNVHFRSVNSKGYKLERINYIPSDAKGMVVGKQYATNVYNKDVTVTLNEDGTVTSNMNYPQWKTVEVEGQEWILIYDEKKYEDVSIATGTIENITRYETDGWLVSPSLEYYIFSSIDKYIKYQNGELILDDDWRIRWSGRFHE